MPAARSVSVTTIRVGPGVDPEAMRAVARERFQVSIAGGLGPLAGRVFRIGHLGDLNPAMILGALGRVEAAMSAQGIAFAPGGVQRAVEQSISVGTSVSIAPGEDEILVRRGVELLEFLIRYFVAQSRVCGLFDSTHR